MKTIELFKKVCQDIYSHKFSFLFTVIFLNIFITTVGIFSISAVFRMILFVIGEENLNKDNFFFVFSNPISLVLLACYILLVVFLMFLEFSILISMIISAQKGVKFSLKRSLKNAIKRLKTVFGPQIFLMVFYFLAMIPLANLGLSSFLTEKLYIPKFITNEFFKTSFTSIMYIFVMLGIFYVNFRMIFVFPLMMTNSKSVLKNMRESWRLTRKHNFDILFSLGVFEVMIYSFVAVIIALIVTFFVILPPLKNNFISDTILFTLIDGVFFTAFIISKIFITDLLITILNFEKKIEIENYEISNKKDKKFSWLAFFAAVFASLVLVFWNGVVIYNFDFESSTRIIAHRGYAKNAVENSLESLDLAAKAGVKFAEVDIIATKDGEFVVSHDYNLKRLAGVNQEIKDMYFKEVVGLPIYQNGFESKIPSLDDCIERAKKDNLKLFVELKPHGFENEKYAENFVKKLKKHKVEKSFRVISLNAGILNKVKKISPETEVGHIIPLQFGGFSHHSKFDFYLIEDFSYHRKMVEIAHSRGKKVYAWTINDDDRILKYFNSPVDGIITDEVEKALNLKKEVNEDNNYFDRIFRILMVKWRF